MAKVLIVLTGGTIGSISDGEIIDVDAYTGGFNLQIAYSTGFTSGKN